MVKITAILTGKKKSSFKNKNRLLIKSKPIFAYPAKAAKKCKKINNYYVSSDSNFILNYCNKIGYTKIKRPDNLCRKNSLHRDVLLHALKYIKKDFGLPDIIVVLLANAPIIKQEWISKCINMLVRDKTITSVVPVIKNNDFNPLRAKKIKNNFLKNFLKTKKKISSNRQSLVGSYFLCHNFWIIRTEEIFKNEGDPPWNFMGKKTVPFIIQNAIDIHNQIDYEIAKILVNDLKIKI